MSKDVENDIVSPVNDNGGVKIDPVMIRFVTALANSAARDYWASCFENMDAANDNVIPKERTTK